MYAATGNPRRTKIRAKKTISGWTLDYSMTGKTPSRRDAPANLAFLFFTGESAGRRTDRKMALSTGGKPLNVLNFNCFPAFRTNLSRLTNPKKQSPLSWADRLGQVHIGAVR